MKKFRETKKYREIINTRGKFKLINMTKYERQNKSEIPYVVRGHTKL